jgi:hypothetical protein
MTKSVLISLIDPRFLNAAGGKSHTRMLSPTRDTETRRARAHDTILFKQLGDFLEAECSETRGSFLRRNPNTTRRVPRVNSVSAES